jgi:3-oxoacyl-[acyl-carrier-protein] synthase-3
VTGVAIAGVGRAVPERVVTNAPIAARLGVDEDWIAGRTGTRERRWLADGERLVDLATASAAEALEHAGIAARDVDLVIVATTSSDEMSPHAAPLVAADLGARGAAAMDVSAACVGFLSATAMAASAIESGRAHTAAVVGADGLSRYLDPDDRQSAMLFGDGAGALILRAADGPSAIGPVLLRSDGDHRDLIRLTREDQRIRMDGPLVFRHAVELLTSVAEEAIDAAGLTLADVDLFVFHQANSRILRAVGQRLGLPADRVVDEVGRFANTSAATLPMALSVAAEDGRLGPGDRVLLAAFGAGLVWGGTVVRWTAPAR